ncbi:MULTISPECIES: glycoside hydrolase family 125 protein [unclassified Enterococcus]|uniref:glycoside hydrolase family 125 protein n=1 Tax=unclassified Enterococcus TaxID=2608891 RepID=UPI001554C3E9|nr:MULTISPECIES: glycoside hydrolase family 125 protein [unclassified Enterococcus]MBS7578149.1 glycoside hydrolase family 125 protein [Enterococcus sp. MMGLQ5-2]MBS7584035.1 glycoside hydrolase family 125 protein [Enterococcus sp. MMGLQ5-1]NPD11896.1 glycoside hydrolase family 125 protein [Enterococcus sp. MMGLQ5-1]NPD37980.1 glycoside hydrolase family 125 protein [Enterococcus sp. MMGLQ5-2]
MTYQEIPQSVQAFMADITQKCSETHPDWAENFNFAFANTLLTTVKRHDDGTTFLLTGDIPAMWLRDSTAQVRPYLVIAKDDSDLADMICGLVKKQFFYINIDPYANAFNEADNGAGHQDDQTAMNGWIWERKFEIDSLCYPIQLAYLLYKNTGRTDQFDYQFISGVQKILDVFKIEQNHAQSEYRFIRATKRQEDTLPNDGLGNPVGYTGMIWSGFRPSDDACQYGYLVPSNMFAVVVLGYLEEIFTTILQEAELAARASQLKEEVNEGILKHGMTRNAAGKTIFAYEVDGLGHATVMDDSNVPNLISAPYLGYIPSDNDIYQATRATLLSQENPYYYTGKYAQGIGSSHTPDNYAWPIAMAMTGLTATKSTEKATIIDQLIVTDAGTHLMHESFDVNDPTQFTREWFSWANMMYCEAVMDYFDIRINK